MVEERKKERKKEKSETNGRTCQKTRLAASAANPVGRGPAAD